MKKILQTLFGLLLQSSIVWAQQGQPANQVSTEPEPYNSAQRFLLDTALAPFYHGVASGDPTASAVIIWTRVTDNTITGSIPVSWRMATDTAFTDVVKSGTVQARPSADYTVKVNVTGLQSNKYYYYQFTALSTYSLTGRTRTLPTGTNVDSIRFGVVSCSNYQSGYFNAYEALANRNDVDVILHLGDYIYEYGTGGSDYNPALNRPHEPIHEIVILPDYRARHSQYKLDPQLRKLHQQYPFICIWDDHETANDSYKDGAENHQPATEGLWADRKLAGQTAYFNWMPIRKPATLTDPTRIYRKFNFGKLIDLYMLDTRLQDRQQQLEFNNPAINDTGRTILGATQRNWLFDGINASTRTWQVLGQQVMVAPINVFGVPVNKDQWDGYPAERTKLYNNFMQNVNKNFVVLTGDIHSTFANDLPLSNYVWSTGANSAGVEFVTTSITSSNPFTFGEGLAQLLNLHAKEIDFTHRGFMIVDFNKNRAQSDWYYVNTITSVNPSSYFSSGWYCNKNERYLRSAGAASVRLPNRIFPFAPSTPMPFVQRLTAADISSHQVVVLGLYPNPASTHIQLHYFLADNDNVKFTITDMKGSVVLQTETGLRQSGIYIDGIDINTLQSGNYILSVVTNKTVNEKQFVVVK